MQTRGRCSDKENVLRWLRLSMAEALTEYKTYRFWNIAAGRDSTRETDLLSHLAGELGTVCAGVVAEER